MFEQIKLNYTDLSPVLDAETIAFHYGKHHATYTKNFNEAVEKAGLTGKTVEEIFSSLDKIEDQALRTALTNNGGGFYNHNLYFAELSKDPVKTPSAELAEKIDQTFGSLDELKTKLSDLAIKQFGSGWAWLSANNQGELMISSSPNQSNPIIEKTGFTPILAIDVWEHAYYLQYKNLRPDYVAKLFDIIDWAKVSENYQKVIK